MTADKPVGTIYVPVKDSALSQTIREGSGIVGIGEHDANDMVLIDFEGNLYNSESFKTWADRVHHAWDRATTKYPTVARRLARRTDLTEVGTFESTFGRIELDPDTAPLAADWLGLNVDQLEPELLSTSRHHVDVRTVQGWTPEQRQQLRFLPRLEQERYRAAGLMP